MKDWGVMDVILVIAACFLFLTWFFAEEEYCEVYKRDNHYLIIKSVEKGYVHYDIWTQRGKIPKSKRVEGFDLRGWECASQTSGENNGK